jgi:hypothetical protein
MRGFAKSGPESVGFDTLGKAVPALTILLFSISDESQVVRGCHNSLFLFSELQSQGGSELSIILRFYSANSLGRNQCAGKLVPNLLESGGS